MAIGVYGWREAPTPGAKSSTSPNGLVKRDHAGSTDGTAYNHYGLLAALYLVFGLGTPPNSTATATPLPIP